MASKRAKLQGVPAADGGSQDLAVLLQLLQTLLSGPGDGSDADGVDELLDELAQLQSNVDRSTQADAAFRAIAVAQEKLQVGLPPPPCCRPLLRGTQQLAQCRS